MSESMGNIIQAVEIYSDAEYVRRSAPLLAQLAGANVEVARLQAIIDSYKPKPATLFGATLRNTRLGNASTSPRPVWDIVRTYTQTDALRALYVASPKGRLVATSYGEYLGGPGWETSSSKVNGLAGQLAALPDIAGVRVADVHEFDNPDKYGTNVASYLAGAAVFRREVAKVNTRRKNPLIIFRCCMAYSHSVPARNLDAFYKRDPQCYDEYGPDVYKLADIPLVVAKATEYGKPLCVPEFGPLTNVEHSDGPITEEMRYGIDAWAWAATWVCWFDKKGSGADLDQYPTALGLWSDNAAGGRAA